MNTITLHKKNFYLPSMWKEITSKELLKITPYLLGTNDTLALRESLVLFTFLPSLKKYWNRHSWVERLIQKYPSLKNHYPILTEGQKWDLLQCTKFLFDDISGRSIVQSFTHNNITYYLPGDNFTRESIIAFAFADEYFNKYIESGDEKYINLLIACIARQKGSTKFPALQFVEGDPREHFSTSRTFERAEAFKTLPIKIRQAVLFFFLGSKKFIHTQYEIIFRKKEKENTEDDQTKKTDRRSRLKAFGKKKIPAPNFNWLGVVYELSEQGTFGNFNEVKHMFIHTCCYYLAKKRYEKEEQTS